MFGLKGRLNTDHAQSSGPNQSDLIWTNRLFPVWIHPNRRCWNSHQSMLTSVWVESVIPGLITAQFREIRLGFSLFSPVWFICVIWSNHSFLLWQIHQTAKQQPMDSLYWFPLTQLSVFGEWQWLSSERKEVHRGPLEPWTLIIHAPKQSRCLKSQRRLDVLDQLWLWVL